MTDATYNKESAEAMKEFAAKNTLYVKASAMVGVDRLRPVLLSSFASQNKREIKAFNRQGDALDRLATK